MNSHGFVPVKVFVLRFPAAKLGERNRRLADRSQGRQGFSQ